MISKPWISGIHFRPKVNLHQISLIHTLCKHRTIIVAASLERAAFPIIQRFVIKPCFLLKESVSNMMQTRFCGDLAMRLQLAHTPCKSDTVYGSVRTLFQFREKMSGLQLRVMNLHACTHFLTVKHLN